MSSGLPEPTFDFELKFHLSLTTGGEWHYADKRKDVHLSVCTGPDGKDARLFTIGETGEQFKDYKAMVEAYQKTDGYINAALKIL